MTPPVQSGRHAAPAMGVAYDIFGEKIGARQIPAGISEVALPRGASLVVRE